MIRQIAATLAVAAVIVHCVIGCCVRCVNACDCISTVACEAGVCPCCHSHELDAELDLCCQPVTSEPLNESSLQDDQGSHSPNHEEHHCGECSTQKCPFIGSESPVERLIESLLLPAQTSWHASSFVSLPKAPEYRLGGLGALGPPHSGAKLRLHLTLAVLTL